MPSRVNKSSILPNIKPRNPVMRSPLLRRGGVHQTSKTSLRQGARQALEAQLDDWREDLEFERSLRDPIEI